MKKLPNGISNYRELIEDGYYYVDKTPYIEKLENLSDKRIMFLRPRKFGKTLFTSMLQYYYDINETDKFENLFSNTYIGNNPTPLKNGYHILRFNFSGIDTKDEESTLNGFRNKIIAGIETFVGTYGLDFYINKEDEAENILNNLLTAFRLQKTEEKIYVIIDEYDHFANELLGFKTDNFKRLVSQNGKVRKWYEVLKEGTENVIGRIFITGVAPITLDSLTSGFNIGKDITRDEEFNEMVGFSKEELMQMMENQEIDKKEQEEIFPIMKENYNGYKFSSEANKKVYNSNMCLYFLNEYTRKKKIPKKLVDVNIASDYSKLAGMLSLCEGEQRREILEKTLSGEEIETIIVDKFNPEMPFGLREFVSMLYYLGYLTVIGEKGEYETVAIPNKMMKELYSSYFLQVVNEELGIDLSVNYAEIGNEMLLEGKITKTVEILKKYLNNLSNRDYEHFDEKYVKLIFYCLVMNVTAYSVRSEQENNRTYQDILLIPRDASKGYQAIMIEFKYLKKSEEENLEEVKKEAREQVKEYSELEQIKLIPNLHKYTVIAVVDEIYLEKID